MRAILRCKKSIIAILVIVLTLAAGLSMLAFEGRVVSVDSTSPNFCRSTQQLFDSDDPMKYDNVVKLDTMDGYFDNIVTYINGDMLPHRDIYTGLYSICVKSKGDTLEKTTASSYLITDVVDGSFDAHLPKVSLSILDTTLVVKVSVKSFNVYTYSDELRPHIGVITITD